jgi:hypothetical protein
MPTDRRKKKRQELIACEKEDIWRKKFGPKRPTDRERHERAVRSGKEAGKKITERIRPERVRGKPQTTLDFLIDETSAHEVAEAPFQDLVDADPEEQTGEPETEKERFNFEGLSGNLTLDQLGLGFLDLGKSWEEREEAFRKATYNPPPDEDK